MEQAIYSAFAWRSAVHNSGLESAAGPESPRLFVPPSLPETPPAQKLQIATSAPPVRRTRSIIPPPAASHPVLTSAFAVAGTGAPDISQAPTRVPTQRQLQLGPMFAFPLLPGPQEPIPFPSSASDTKPASLLEKVNSLPGPKDMLRSIIAERHNSLSLQDSSMLSDMLRRSAPLHTDTEAPVAANSAGSAYSQAGVSDDSARPSRSGGKAQPVKVGVKPLHKLEDLTHSAASSTSSSYLTSSRSAFSKCRLQTTWAVRNTGDAGRKGISPALPFLGQFVPALPCKGADRAVPANAQAHCHSSWSVLEGPTGQGTYIGPLASCLETAQGPLQNSPNGCCISPHQHQHLAAAYRLQEQAPHDSPVQKRGSMSPLGNNGQTHSTFTGFRAAPSSRNKQQHLRSATTGSRAALRNCTGVFQSPTKGTASGAFFLPAHAPYLRADTSCPKGQPKPPFPAGLLEGSCANDNLLSQAQAAQLERFRATPNSLECCLVFPHGSRCHKRPKLEDRLKERHLMAATHVVKARTSDKPAPISMFGPDR